ncbi:MAG: hypothetical protein AVDCRST_MAG38-888, partial [uncultured Solirubrobacteraceae bacterium]
GRRAACPRRRDRALHARGGGSAARRPLGCRARRRGGGRRQHRPRGGRGAGARRPARAGAHRHRQRLRPLDDHPARDPAGLCAGHRGNEAGAHGPRTAVVGLPLRQRRQHGPVDLGGARGGAAEVGARPDGLRRRRGASGARRQAAGLPGLGRRARDLRGELVAGHRGGERRLRRRRRARLRRSPGRPARRRGAARRLAPGTGAPRVGDAARHDLRAAGRHPRARRRDRPRAAGGHRAQRRRRGDRGRPARARDARAGGLLARRTGL